MKAILIFDMPKDCLDCPCFDDFQGCCQVIANSIDTYAAKPEWCPLKPMPDAIEERQSI